MSTAVTEITVSRHAVVRYHQQARSEYGNKVWQQGDNAIRAEILRMWRDGNDVVLSQKEKRLKLKKYGVDDLIHTHHKRCGAWVVTKHRDVIVTVHYKTQAERNRDKRRRRGNKDRRKRKQK